MVAYPVSGLPGPPAQPQTLSGMLSFWQTMFHFHNSMASSSPWEEHRLSKVCMVLVQAGMPAIHFLVVVAPCISASVDLLPVGRSPLGVCHGVAVTS